MWTDNETTADLIGFRVHADLVRSVVTDQTLLPATIGIFGDWGGGKTSIMRMLEQDLQPERYPVSAQRSRYEQIACLYFNGWLFEGYDDAKAALLSAILLALGEHKRFGARVRERVVSLLKSVNVMRIARLGAKEVALPAVAAYVTGGASLIPSAAFAAGRLSGGVAEEKQVTAVGSASGEPGTAAEVDWEKLLKNDNTSTSPLDVRTFRERFAKLLRDSDIQTLIVLIDDLDRCSPERIIDNLEAIKLFLNVPGTAFVIGADPRIVRHAIAMRYRTGDVFPSGEAAEEEERLVTDYLEKLIQVPYWLPRLSPAEVETYMTLLFCHRDLDPPRWELCVLASEQQRSANRYGVFGYAGVRAALGGGELGSALTESLAFCAAAAPLITEGLKGNPRQVKRFLNALALRKKLATIAKLTNVRDDVLVKLMILEYAQPRAFRQLFEWQASQAGMPKELRSMESRLAEPGSRGPESTGERPDLPWTSDFLSRWLQMPPHLADVDLRDYFWVARDRLASTFAGLSMVPPLVRRAFEDLISDNPGRRPAGLTATAAMDSDQRQMLLEMLRTQVARHPDQKVGYDAFRTLIEREVPAASTVFSEVAATVPAARIPAAVGLDIRNLIKARAELASQLQPVLDSWAQTSTQVGRALKPRAPR